MTTSEIYEPLKKSRSAWHDVRGVRYHVREWGKADAPLVVLLHGWGDASASFQFMVDNLVNDWFVVAPDWRGFGLSRYRTHSYWFPDYVADLDVLLSIYQRKRPVFLLGHSMGANAAGLYAGIFEYACLAQSDKLVQTEFFDIEFGFEAFLFFYFDFNP